MGRMRKRFNWKAREQVNTVVDNSETKKIKLDANIGCNASETGSNALVLPSKKRKTKKIKTEPPKKQLSKKERRKLECVLKRAEKRKKRSTLLEALAKVQADPNEMCHYLSTADMQTKHKRLMKHPDERSGEHKKVKSVKGANKQKQDDSETDADSDESPSKGEESDSNSDDASNDDENNDDSDESKNEYDKDESRNCQKPAEKCEESCSKLEMGERISIDVDKDLGGNIVSESKPSIEKCKSDGDQAATTSASKFHLVHVPVERSEEMQLSRLSLPILSEEQLIMEAVSENPVVVICGETGCGKTTQLPQFLYEAGYATSGMIAVSEPRRVAAVTMSQRVGLELSSPHLVSYQIRYSGNVSDATRIKFMTDGVLLREIQSDFLLTRYSVIIIDEAHERSVFTDILLGLLSRIVPLRIKRGLPVKLIIMSATLRVRDFTENQRLFKMAPPIVRVDSRQYPVTIHFNKRTPLDEHGYLAEAYRKVCKIHSTLPAGGILVFVTGQQEVNTLCAKLRRRFPHKASQGRRNIDESERNDVTAMRSSDGGGGETNSGADNGQGKSRKKSGAGKSDAGIILPDVNLDDYCNLVVRDDDESDEDGDCGSDVGDAAAAMWDGDDMEGGSCCDTPLHVLPLYSLLHPSKQAQVFTPPPTGTRLCVVSTNVAETSVTIPDVAYVVDPGKVKLKYYDPVTGVSTFRVSWTSKASACQRAGRAGRTQPGHCYRLYSSAVYNDELSEFTVPEIQRRPVDDLLLQMKAMNIDRVVNFPFPTPPDMGALRAAEELLIFLGALKVPEHTRHAKPIGNSGGKRAPQSNQQVSEVSTLGRVMSQFPVAPRYGKMLALSHQPAGGGGGAETGAEGSLVPYTICLVSSLTVRELFDEQQQQQRGRAKHVKRAWMGQNAESKLLGDFHVYLSAVGACEYSGQDARQFALTHSIRYKALLEIRKLRQQLTNAVISVSAAAAGSEDGGAAAGSTLCVDPKMAPPSERQCRLLRQVLLAGLGDHIARKVDESSITDGEERVRLKGAYQSTALEEPVYIHPSSVLYKRNPQYIIYVDIVNTSKHYMKVCAAIEPEWLPVLFPTQCVFSKPESDSARYDQQTGTVRCLMTCTFGRRCWQVPACDLEYPHSLDKYKWLAKYILDGSVCPALLPYVADMVMAPIMVTKSWSRLQSRCDEVVQSLMMHNIENREALLRQWELMPKFLLNSYLLWLPESHHDQVRKIWPPLPS